MLDTVHGAATNILSESIIHHPLRRHMMSKIISAEVIPDLGFLFEVLQNNDDCPKCERTGNNSEAAFEVGGRRRRKKKGRKSAHYANEHNHLQPPKHPTNFNYTLISCINTSIQTSRCNKPRKNRLSGTTV